MWLDGFYTKDGNTYLYENGQRVSSKTVCIDGFYYRTAPSGKIRKNENYKIAIPELNGGEPLFYYFDAEGKMWLDGIYEKDGVKYLYKDGQPVRSTKDYEIDGVFYDTYYSGKIK